MANSLLGKDKVNGKGKEKEQSKAENAEPTTLGRRAKFMLGSDSDVDLPASFTNASRSRSPVPPLSLSASLSRDMTSSPSPIEQRQPSIHRPALLRRDAVISPEEPVGRRRWTLASVITDEGISDEGLVKELEKMRQVVEWARRREKERKGGTEQAVADEDEEEEMGVVWDIGMDVWEKEREKGGGVLYESPHSETGTVTPDETDGHANNNEKRASFPLLPYAPSSGPSTTRRSTAPSPTWLAAQRALLICRELILTERHYLSLLLSLLSQHTATPPPPLMLRYVEELVRASAGVLAGMEKEPSVGGVARAFLEKEEEVMLAYVGWCGVVGGWFVNNHHEGGKVVDGQAGLYDEDAKTPLKRTVSMWRKSMPSIAALGLEGGGMISVYGRGERDPEKEKERSKAMLSPPPAGIGVGVVPPSVSAASALAVPVSRSISSIGLVSSMSTSAAMKGPQQQRKPPSVRELAILPTQRVMRYVLLYRDLLSHTPHTSPSRAFVERAVETACRIADKCDRAQGNAAFVASSSTGHGGASENGSSAKESKSNSAVSEDGHSKPATSPISAVFPISLTTSLSTTGGPGVLKKKKPMELPVGSSVMGGRMKNTRTVSMKSLSGLGWGRNVKAENGDVPMVVNLGGAGQEEAAVTTRKI
ncbi:hypothetical protein CPB84DRAFT_1764839 [Gymnopilus junonius]|uniref:DH domain-containing protein n=1 Tax=Gymnopilus junonius TaxID=109634 RepID=A0A9P5NZ46_GYMJU|nr:hypothetical protein CPB84DRAFT_1764839 [Gymnopilus junonius]